MTRILLVGELNETLKSISEHLMKNFQVQICSENVKNVIDMIKIFKPSALVINVTEVKEDVVSIFDELKYKNSFMPMVVIASKEAAAEIGSLLDNFRKKKGFMQTGTY